MSYVAIAAFALTVGVKVVDAANAQMYIYQYTDGSDDTTTGEPDCRLTSAKCALLFKYDPNTPDHIGAPVINPATGEQEYAPGVRN